MKVYLDLLHGISRMNVDLQTAIEFIILLNYDGQLDVKSSIETEIFTSAIKQDGCPYLPGFWQFNFSHGQP